MATQQELDEKRAQLLAKMNRWHTPGPWKWTDEFRDSGGGSTWSLVGAGGYSILSCDGEANSPLGLGDVANAKLIAAAPQMLAALEEAMEFLANGTPIRPGSVVAESIAEAIRAAK